MKVVLRMMSVGDGQPGEDSLSGHQMRMMPVWFGLMSQSSQAIDIQRQLLGTGETRGAGLRWTKNAKNAKNAQP
jgi:hypothetical protein